MPTVKGKGLTTGGWEQLIEDFDNVANKWWARGEESRSLNVVFDASFDALAERKRDNILKMAVLAPGVAAPIDMLLNLWEIQVRCGVLLWVVIGRLLVDGGQYAWHQVLY